MTARLLGLAREAATSRGDARTAARLALTEALREEQRSASTPCMLAPFGWYCTRIAGHDGPCAADRMMAPWTRPGPEGVGYLCADGTRARTLRAAVRSWTAAATGRTPGQPGAPRTREPALERAPKATRTSVTVRLPEDVLAWCREHGGVTAAIERAVRAMMREAAAHDLVTTALWRSACAAVATNPKGA